MMETLVVKGLTMGFSVGKIDCQKAYYMAPQSWIIKIQKLIMKVWQVMSGLLCGSLQDWKTEFA